MKPKPIFRLLNFRHLSTKTPKNDYVLTEYVGDKSIITLNRPEALNALSTDIMNQLRDSLLQSSRDKSLIILKACAASRAFSSGGDMKEFATFSSHQFSYISLLIHAMVHLIHVSKIPVVSFMHGIAYGGGAALSHFSRYQIATEATRFGMPEAKLGFHANVGASYFLNRTVGRLGYYMALTGEPVKGADAVHAGFASHYCLSENLGRLEEAILRNRPEDVEGALEEVCEKSLPEFTLAPEMDVINRCFDAPTVGGIIRKLDGEKSIFAKNALSAIKSGAPTSLAVTLKQLQRGKDYSVEDSLAMEANLSVNFYKFPDVIEGTRIVLVDKGDAPKWSPPRLEDVTEELVEKHFEQHSSEDFRQLIRQFQRVINGEESSLGV
ncbi:unnamed protein product [Phyllotreta striolata]|uniref:3-hydroxyisobutyryl-CoA hydrolase, mitochondrial n=1 Tax=Phyllotreta striolata TaxID=444603 RepID=A0A9N9XPY5_PHYSR|nr:unnamed protein product [Phyllotreta striolata]